MARAQSRKNQEIQPLLHSFYLVFVLIDELQQIHGLRVDDFVRYRRYCSRKLERLRSKFNLKHTKTSRVKVTEDLVKANPEALHLILFKCEWFLAQINQLRNELGHNSRKKHHLRSICMNSMKYIDELLSLSQNAADESHRLEYLAYCNLVKGIVKNELKEFSLAYNSLEKSKIIMEEMLKGTAEESEEYIIFDRKLNEVETIMRVCQYSADMYDVVIEIDEAALNEFKMNQLTEKLNESGIKDDKGDILMKFGGDTFKLSKSINIIDPAYKNLHEARRLLSKSQDINEIKNLLLQVAYFENRRLSKIVKREFIKKSPCFEFDKYSKLLSRLKGYEVDPNYSKAIDLFCNFLKGIKDSDGKRIKETFEMIKENEESVKEYKFKFLSLLLKNASLIISSIKLSDNDSNIPASTSTMQSGPVYPKPSFYDMAFDCLTSSYTGNTQSIKVKQSSGGLSNLLSSFWGAKK